MVISGQVTKVEWLNPLLMTAALDAVKKYRYTPYEDGSHGPCERRFAVF